MTEKTIAKLIKIQVFILVCSLATMFGVVILGIQLLSHPTRQEVYDHLYNSKQHTQFIRTQAEEKLKQMCPSLTQDKKDFSVLVAQVIKLTARDRQSLKWSYKPHRHWIAQHDSFMNYEWGKKEE